MTVDHHRPVDRDVSLSARESQSRHCENRLLTKRKCDNNIYSSQQVLDAPHVHERIRSSQQFTLKDSPLLLQLGKKKSRFVSVETRPGAGPGSAAASMYEAPQKT